MLLAAHVTTVHAQETKRSPVPSQAHVLAL